MAPDGLTLIEISARELHRLGNFIRAGRRLQDPDMGVAPGVQVTLIISAIHRTVDHMHIRFVLTLGWTIARLRILFALGFLQVLLRRRALEGDPGAVGRPYRARGPF